ncbi:putative iron export permease protein FetB [Anaerotignum neopropionicum]|uniref:Putative iron export permease protein FetB n=1 Tax=Anaerotignum neopropionicum TaxID=36847 RepID=A0A136WEY4_9FIRM|nr:ABC transporter permease [Anaerotignum neopropionicum]KXL52993.1 putative iron export permease protein FetB [Anaerotignum neopropionicum]
MNHIVVLNLWQFGIVYLLLLIVLAIMKHCKINQSKLLVVGSFRMSVQLVLAGLILTYIFKNPHPLFVLLYLSAMIALSIHTALARNKGINRRFQRIVACALTLSGLFVILFFVTGVVGVSFWNPQYTIPISGMIMGNAMTGVSLGLKTFHENITIQKTQIDTLLYMGAAPKNILLPFVNKAVETALLPTLNSLLGMGIISLPGMMTGQILSGTLPTTAIMYQIAIMIAITAVVCLAVFCSLFFGYRTLYNKQNQIKFT